MKISARDTLLGKVVEVHRGAATSYGVVEIGDGQRLFASITNEAVADLGLAPGKAALAVIKASDVMVAVDS